MLLLFNWEELKQAQSHISKLILFYCVIVNQLRENRWLAKNEQHLINKLKITDVPYALYSSQLIRKTKRGLISNYDCIEPQTYVMDYSFVFEDMPTEDKVNYIELLSLRHVNNRNNWIPINYARLPLRTNPFTTVIGDRIVFSWEEEE